MEEDTVGDTVALGSEPTVGVSVWLGDASTDGVTVTNVGIDGEAVVLGVPIVGDMVAPTVGMMVSGVWVTAGAFVYMPPCDGAVVPTVDGGAGANDGASAGGCTGNRGAGA